jgi:hypothetical protein
LDDGEAVYSFDDRENDTTAVRNRAAEMGVVLNDFIADLPLAQYEWLSDFLSVILRHKGMGFENANALIEMSPNPKISRVFWTGNLAFENGSSVDFWAADTPTDTLQPDVHDAEMLRIDFVATDGTYYRYMRDQNMETLSIDTVSEGNWDLPEPQEELSELKKQKLKQQLDQLLDSEGEISQSEVIKPLQGSIREMTMQVKLGLDSGIVED